MGSWPSVASPLEVAELSRISVFGCGGGAIGSSELLKDFFFAGCSFPVETAVPFPGCAVCVGVPAEGVTAGVGADEGPGVDGCGAVGACVCEGGVTAGFGACGLVMGVCGVPEASFGSDDAGCC